MTQPREYAQRVSTLDELLSISDSVSVHVPLNNETYQLLDSKRLAQMKSGSVLINTSRGGIVDEKALIHHIQNWTSWWSRFGCIRA